ncbi:TniQ family protein [Mesorhizobium caraganae]|uniref:TniQ family protein n=1 Tax=Mesorhizobium caraganae TaxID=483206 RepID=UPI0028AE3E08|nr:TniQ family protein [Mesorhizobium caraganae]
MAIDPQPDELLSSWLHRLAIANGIAPRLFANVLGLGDGMWSPRLDLRLPRDVAALLCHQSGVPQEAISGMAMTGPALSPLLLPLRENARRNRSTWMQYCPQCLAGDEAPYFRRQWRLASRISCFLHGCGLRDRCPACRSGIASFDQTELMPQQFCARCAFDLRRASKVFVKTSARRLERSIDDICKVEMAKGATTIGELISRLLRVPIIAGVASGKTLTNLSTSSRIRCFEWLADKPVSWLTADEHDAVARRRRLILAAGGHGRLIAHFADFMDKHQGSQSSVRSPPPGADLAVLLEAYSRATDRAIRTKRHPVLAVLRG